MCKQPLKKVPQEYVHCFLGPDVISYLQVTFESNTKSYVLLHFYLFIVFAYMCGHVHAVVCLLKVRGHRRLMTSCMKLVLEVCGLLGLRIRNEGQAWC